MDWKIHDPDKEIRTYRTRSKKKQSRSVLRASLAGTLALLILLFSTTVTHENGNLPVGNYKFMKMLEKSVHNPDKGNAPDPRKVADLLGQCEECFNAHRLTTGEGLTALECYHQVLGMDPGNTEARAGLEKIASRYVVWAKAALTDKKLEKARQYLQGLAATAPNSPDLIQMRAQLRELEAPSETENADPPPDMPEIPAPEHPDETGNAQVTELLGQCQKHLRAKRLTSGKGGTALECFREVLRQSPENPEAQAGLKKIENQYILWTNQALRDKRPKKASQYLEGLAKVNPRSPDLTELRQRVADLKSPPPRKTGNPSPETKRRKYKKTDTLTEMSLGVKFHNSD